VPPLSAGLGVALLDERSLIVPKDAHILRTAADVTAEVLADAERVYDGWFSGDDRIDWEDFVDRLAQYGAVSNPAYDFDAYDDPSVRKIQRHIRKIANA